MLDGRQEASGVASLPLLLLPPLLLLLLLLPLTLSLAVIAGCSACGRISMESFDITTAGGARSGARSRGVPGGTPTEGCEGGRVAVRMIMKENSTHHHDDDTRQAGFSIIYPLKSHYYALGQHKTVALFSLS